MRLLALSGSLKATSTNTNLIHALVTLAPAEVDVQIYDGLAELPHFSPDIDTETAPETVWRWREAIRQADAVIISTPEYAYGMPGSLKNALDWVVSSGELVDKPVGVMSASPSYSGGAKAQASVLLTLTALSARMTDGAHLTVPLANKKVGAGGEVYDEGLREGLGVVLKTLIDLASAAAEPD